jgi:ATP-dependent helicase YprA (DUF1998 family)
MATTDQQPRGGQYAWWLPAPAAARPNASCTRCSITARVPCSDGAAGIKALVIYPMNALATDQARRFAQVIARTPAFKGAAGGAVCRRALGQGWAGPAWR